jgi:hypothetical protein
MRLVAFRRLKAQIDPLSDHDQIVVLVSVGEISKAGRPRAAGVRLIALEHPNVRVAQASQERVTSR